ncbi:MAG TPA: phosphatidate cytidylyltransferase [Gemmataceae bacterium]|jgi:phosphatidate cytidylyltransferase|nr:phosphatidate cytidylyltransferase [Gemmataceae bacterium]
MGAILIAVTVGVLIVDQWLGGWYPFLFVTVVTMAALACFELRQLLEVARRPPAWLCFLAVIGLVACNWVRPLGEVFARSTDPWHAIAGLMAGIVLAGFLWEMATFHGPGGSVQRIATLLFMAAYLGLLPCFLIQLRFPATPPASGEAHLGSVSLALAIFVPKCCDTGAYFTGRLIGKHPMAPVLSPKKTWEGAAGGLAASVAAAVGINRLGPVLNGIGTEITFGLTVGIAAMLGDLAESLIKRDFGRKDASEVLPGFGGILDVIDSILFASPVAFCWLAK